MNKPGININLEGKNALITGASRGIGASIALHMAQCGANVAINYSRSVKEAETVARKAEFFGVKTLLIQSNTADFQKAQENVENILSHWGKIDILVNNAGINRDTVIWKMTENQWDEVLNVNLKGYFNYVRAVAPVFKKQQSGVIINISSINGLRGKFGQTNYSAAKAGIIGFTKALAREMGKYHVRVNAIAPGLIETDMIRSAGEEIIQKALQEIVLNKIGKVEDIAYLTVFLCSSLAGHITGEVIKVDGGQYI